MFLNRKSSEKQVDPLQNKLIRTIGVLLDLTRNDNLKWFSDNGPYGELFYYANLHEQGVQVILTAKRRCSLRFENLKTGETFTFPYFRIINDLREAVNFKLGPKTMDIVPLADEILKMSSINL